jgi:heme iron utilization protein
MLSRQHAAPPALEVPSVPAPSLAERARTLFSLGRLGSLATHSRKQPGYPFASVTPYSPDEQGRPVFLISSMAMHTQNLVMDARASLLVTEEGGDDPLAAARVTLLGEVLPVSEPETAQVRDLYLKRYENARSWVNFNDFSFYRLQPADIYFIAGFGVMGWISAEEYGNAEPDPLAESASGILRHVNQHHADALIMLARSAGESDAEHAVMTAIDRLGFHLRLRSGERIYGVRLAFPGEVRTASEVREVLVQMAQDARG